ncbi:hypothetical protein LEAN103870_00930 [Legionella anisa]|nr:hypothetical protein Lani_3464 [Legionella anisa]
MLSLMQFLSVQHNRVNCVSLYLHHQDINGTVAMTLPDAVYIPIIVFNIGNIIIYLTFCAIILMTHNFLSFLLCHHTLKL